MKTIAINVYRLEELKEMDSENFQGRNKEEAIKKARDYICRQMRLNLVQLFNEKVDECFSGYGLENERQNIAVKLSPCSEKYKHITITTENNVNFSKAIDVDVIASVDGKIDTSEVAIRVSIVGADDKSEYRHKIFDLFFEILKSLYEMVEEIFNPTKWEQIIEFGNRFDLHFEIDGNVNKS